MARPTLQLHPRKEPVTAHPAATLLLLRDGALGVEVLMTRRSPKASFLPGAYVFPGGRVDPADHQAHTLARAPDAGGRYRTAALAALRETFEELGILLAVQADGKPITHTHLQELDRSQALYPQLHARGWSLTLDQMRMLACWTTDRSVPKRFSTTFFAAMMPAQQDPVADEMEQFEPVWVRPQDALAQHQAGNFFMIFPTIRTLHWLSDFEQAEQALAACTEDAPLWSSCPRGGLVGGQPQRFMEHEAPYGELALVCPDGQLEHPLDWQHERQVPLLRHLHRLTAPNASVMTGPGTNSYIVGDAATGYLVIDPGPGDADHVARLFEATGGDIRLIVCTHSHADHSPGARPLQSMCTNKPPILGLASLPTARPNSEFTPDRPLADGERLTLSGGGIEHTLVAVHTPGHAANHLCLVLVEDGLLFSGDHILNGSTTVIDPPDGHMGDYLDSLDKLADACVSGGIEFILPAHGHVLGFAHQAITQLRAHRLRREAKIAAAMQALPHGSLQEWVEKAYDDVPSRLWPVAARSLQAHVDHIREQALS